MLKKILSLILSVLICLTLPIAVSAAGSTASAYDVYISGNFLVGEQLTAHYTYYDPNSLPELEADTEIAWYSIDPNGNETQLGTGKTYTVEEKLYKDGTKSSSIDKIFIRVTVANTQGSATPVYSGCYGYVNKKDTTAAASPGAFTARLESKGRTGGISVGSELVARFSYVEPSGLSEGNHQYAWYTQDYKGGARTLVQPAGTSDTYTVRAADYGKKIQCEITPVASDGTRGNTVTVTQNFGNLFMDKSAVGKIAANGYYAGKSLPLAAYLSDRLMHDTTKTYYHVNTYGNTSLASRWHDANAGRSGLITFDLGRSQKFDGFYLWINKIPAGLTIAYSNDNSTWTNVDLSTCTASGCEILLNEEKSARYFKIDFLENSVNLFDFYPFSTDRFMPTLTLKGSSTVSLIEGDSYTDPGFSAQDAQGNDLSDKVTISGNTVDVNNTGTYEVIYTLRVDGYPDITALRTVNVASRAEYEAERQKVRDAQAALTLPFDASGIYANVTLPSAADNGVAISWSSNKPGVLSGTGSVSRGSADETVTLTATLSNAALTLTKDFTVVVLRKTTPALLDVYISGNLVVGETLTAEYQYANENGLQADEGAMTYQWYKKNDFNNSGSGAISGATQKSYTVTADDVDFKLFVAVTPAAVDGETGSKTWSGMTDVVKSKSTVDAPVISFGYINSVSAAKTMLVGDTLRVHYSYVERGGSAEGTPSFIWQTRKTADDTPTIVQQKSTNDTYTLQTDDFGKIIECVVTTENSDGGVSNSLTVRSHYGNAFLGNDITALTGTLPSGQTKSYYFYGCALPSYRVVAHEDAGYLYTYKNTEGTTEAALTFDVGRMVDVNAFYISVAGCTMSNINIQHSTDNVTWSEAPITTTSTTDTLTVPLDKVIQARYFRLGGNPTGGYMKLNAFYPYLSVSAASTLSLTDGETMAVKQYSVFSDPGFTAADPYGNDASANVLVNGSVDTQRLGTYPLTYTLTCAGYPSLTQTRTVTVVKGIAQDGDLAFEKYLTENGTAVSALTDGNEFTSETLAAGEHTFILDLGSVTGVDEIKALAGNGAAYALTVYGSEDETVWKTLGSSATGGNVTFTPTEVRYIKLVLTLAAQTDINSIEAYLSDAGKVQLAAEGLSLPQSTTADLALATSGKYGTQISWSSDKPGVIGTEGAVIRGQTDETVTLTANITCNAAQTSKVFTVTVGAYSSGGINSGAPAGGGSGLFNSAKLDVSATTQTPTLKSAFADVDGTHWAFEYIVSLYKAGLISGRSEDSFVPDGEITRAEFLKLLLTAFYPDSVQGSCNFTDVSENDWFYSYIAKAQTIGLTNGYEDGSFRPNDPILRRDIAVFIERLLEITGRGLEKANGQTLADFDTVAAYAQNAVSYLVSAGIISGNDRGEFLPDKNTTRAETAKMIYLVRQALQEVIK